ncbi:MAG: hypothetical protein AAGA80_05110 [Cyanobacteria bacterium P01_F01_bin.143]
MPLNLDHIDSISFSLDNLPQLKPGISFYEIKIPNKYIVFDKFFAFSNIIPGATSGRVYFQTANNEFRNSTPSEYTSAKDVPFNGIGQAIKDQTRSTICFSDPGIFSDKNIITSWYSEVDKVDICAYIGQFLQHWLNCISLKPDQILMIGSSAGSFGALRSATFLDGKTNVLSVNGQIDRDFKYKGNTYRHDLINYFEKYFRLKKNNLTIPNIYLLCNYRDRNIRLNRVFADLISNFPYEKRGTTRPNIVLDFYDGIYGHGRPHKGNLLEKINIADLVLKSSQNEQNFQRSETIRKRKLAQV